MSYFVSGPEVARGFALALPTAGQLSCFVKTSLLVHQVPEEYVAPFQLNLPSI